MTTEIIGTYRIDSETVVWIEKSAQGSHGYQPVDSTFWTFMGDAQRDLPDIDNVNDDNLRNRILQSFDDLIKRDPSKIQSDGI